MEIKDLLCEAGIYSKFHAAQIGMSEHIYKHARYKSKISDPWRIILELRAGHHPDWKGFKIRQGTIYTPSGETVQKNHIDQIHWHQNLAYERGRLAAEEIQHKLVWE
jgi:hypothetical protein